MLIQELTRREYEPIVLVVDAPDLMNAMKRQSRVIIFGSYTLPRFNVAEAWGAIVEKRNPDMPSISARTIEEDVAATKGEG